MAAEELSVSEAQIVSGSASGFASTAERGDDLIERSELQYFLIGEKDPELTLDLRNQHEVVKGGPLGLRAGTEAWADRVGGDAEYVSEDAPHPRRDPVEHAHRGTIAFVEPVSPSASEISSIQSGQFSAGPERVRSQRPSLL
jgi:hypothetical protein